VPHLALRVSVPRVGEGRVITSLLALPPAAARFVPELMVVRTHEEKVMTWNLFAALRKSPRKAERPGRRSFQPLLESLEGRWVPSVSHLVFTIDAATTLSLSGNALGTDMTEQVPGSLTTTVSGTQAVNYDPVAQTLQFDTRDSTVTAAVFTDQDGNPVPLQPDVGGNPGSAPADFGGQLVGIVTIYAAVRDSTSNVNSNVLGINPDASFFPFVSLNLTGGSLDYNAGLFGQGSLGLANTQGMNQSTNYGYFQDLGGGQYDLTLPILVTYNTSIGGAPASFTVTGRLHATAAIPTVTLNNGTLGGNDYATTFSVSAAGPVNVTDPAAVISSFSPNQTLQSLTITLTNPNDGFSESLDADITVSSSPLTKSYDPSTGTLTISGAGSLADYTAVLETVVYSNNAVSDMSDRFITFVAFDGLNNSMVSTTDLSFVP
jgi:hypothetical protein